MNPGIPRFASLSLLLVLLSMLFPALVHAQAGASVTSVTRNTIFSDVATIITVGGSSFDSGSRIFLDGTELPGTVFVSDSQLQVTVPAGTSVGTHIVTVSSGGVAASDSVSLTVSPPQPPAPTATMAPAPVVRPQIGVEIYRTAPSQPKRGSESRDLTRMGRLRLALSTHGWRSFDNQRRFVLDIANFSTIIYIWYEGGRLRQRLVKP